MFSYNEWTVRVLILIKWCRSWANIKKEGKLDGQKLKRIKIEKCEHKISLIFSSWENLKVSNSTYVTLNANYVNKFLFTISISCLPSIVMHKIEGPKVHGYD